MKQVWAALAFVLWSTGMAQAEWTQDAGGAGRTAARVCAAKDTGVCFGLGCAGGPLAFELRLRDVDAGLEDVETLVFVGATALAPMVFQRQGKGVYAAPVEEAHVPGIKRLKAGARMELRYWPDADARPVLQRLTLAGSRVAIEAVEAVCPLPDFEARARAARVTGDPAARIAAQMREACAVLGGELRETEGFVQEIDIDGVAPIDLQVNHARLVCSENTSLVCGPAGCLTSLWQALPEGDYGQVFLNAVQAVAEERPGAVRVTHKGSLCGRIGAGACEKVYVLEDAWLVLEEE